MANNTGISITTIRKQIMYNKNNIDSEAEHEATALKQQGRSRLDKRVRLESSDYNKTEFDKLFRTIPDD